MKLQTKLKFWLPAVLWAILIFLFSSFETIRTSKIYWQDFLVKKTAHVIEYGIFFILLYRALINTGEFSRWQAAWISLVIATVYGASDEIHQAFVPGRESAARDILFDAGGAILSWILLWKWLPKAPKILANLAKNLQIT